MEPLLPPPLQARLEKIRMLPNPLTLEQVSGQLATPQNRATVPRYGIYYHKYIRKIKAGPIIPTFYNSQTNNIYFAEADIPDIRLKHRTETETYRYNATIDKIFLWDDTFEVGQIDEENPPISIDGKYKIGMIMEYHETVRQYGRDVKRKVSVTIIEGPYLIEIDGEPKISYIARVNGHTQPDIVALEDRLSIHPDQMRRNMSENFRGRLEKLQKYKANVATVLSEVEKPVATVSAPMTSAAFPGAVAVGSTEITFKKPRALPPDIITHIQGYLVDPRKEKNLTESLKKLEEEKERKRIKGKIPYNLNKIANLNTRPQYYTTAGAGAGAGAGGQQVGGKRYTRRRRHRGRTRKARKD